MKNFIDRATSPEDPLFWYVLVAVTVGNFLSTAFLFSR